MTAAQQERTPEPVLEARGVTMRFGGLTAVNDVDLVVHDREIVGLIGPNGAGKTTFFNCLTGLYVPTAGEVGYRGNPLSRKPYLVTTAGIARTFQNIRLFPNMTALENVLVGRPHADQGGLLSAIGRGPGFHREEQGSVDRARELLAFVGLSKVTDTSLATCRTATSAGSRSPAPSPANRACCCSTSRPPA